MFNLKLVAKRELFFIIYRGYRVKLLQYILNEDRKILVGSSLFIATIISSIAFADNSKDGFPPAAPEQKNKSVSKTMPAPAPQVILPVQSGFYPQMQRYNQPQQMQNYRPSPYAYYYPQQQAVYTPKQWNYYPQQNPQQRFSPPYPRYQPYTQNQSTPYPVATYPMGNQRPTPYPQASANNNVANMAGNNSSRTLYPMRKKIKKEKHSWGEERHIWPDFYTGFTGDVWDKMINAPFDVGRMPGGWRAPSLSTPDPATVSDAVANQMPPIAEEMGNMTNFAN